MITTGRGDRTAELVGEVGEVGVCEISKAVCAGGFKGGKAVGEGGGASVKLAKAGT